jgi:acyl-CoA synthetase (AMP-forming)/AMP-acid ligase II
MAEFDLLDWLADPSTERGIDFLQDDGEWRNHSYYDLAAATVGRAQASQDRGLRPGDVAVLLHKTGPGFLASFFGTLAAGGTPAPLAPPQVFADSRRWVDHAAHVIRTVAPRVVIADPALADLAEAAIELSGHDCTLLSEEAPPVDPATWRPGVPPELALIQFTSGSRGAARGVGVSRANLTANITMINRALGTPRDFGTIWLPLYHDMGLIGGFLHPVVKQLPLRMMRPDQFIYEPARWLAGFGHGAGEVMAMPNFGFDYVARRVKPEQLATMDFSGVNAVVNAAERVRRSSVEAFYRLLTPFGLRWNAFHPMYGLAEATLGVTGSKYGQEPFAVAVDTGTEQFGGPLTILDSAEAGVWAGEHANSPDTVWHVSCGVPLDGVSVDIVDESDAALPEGHVGEIVVGGPSVAAGYVGENTPSTTRFQDGQLFTGDAGFQYRGELFVLGRMGDSLKIRGRNIYVEEIEEILAEQSPVPWTRSVVLAGHQPDGATVLVVTELPLDADAGTVLLDAARKCVGDDVRVSVLKVPRRRIQYTSSGKPRRTTLWRDLLADDSGSVVLARHQPPTETDAPATVLEVSL